MKKTWRWPLAGFLLGGLLGATILTVNVVGASGPNAPPARVASFGEILHTPPLLVRVGKAVNLSFGVVCGIVGDNPGGRCTPRGAVLVRAAGEAGFRKLPLARRGIRPRDGLARAGRTAVRRRPGVQG